MSALSPKQEALLKAVREGSVLIQDDHGFYCIHPDFRQENADGRSVKALLRRQLLANRGRRRFGGFVMELGGEA
jgi:hypothetical protein